MQTRRGFLGRLLALPALGLVPRSADPQAQTEYRIRAFHVAGFNYYDGPGLVGEMAPGDALLLTPEPENPHDALAVRISWRGHKIGYVPRRENRELQALLRDGAPVRARVGRVDPEADVWRAVWTEVWLG